MSQVPLLTASTAPADSRATLAQIQGAFGTVPAMFAAVAHSPAALASMWAGFGALGGGTLPAVLGEKLAVAIADRNRCGYCLAAHTALGRKAGASAAEMARAQAGESDDPATAAALAFALELVEPSVGRDHALCEDGVALDQRVDRIDHRFLGEAAHFGNLAIDLAELVFECGNDMACHDDPRRPQPKRPVM